MKARHRVCGRLALPRARSESRLVIYLTSSEASRFKQATNSEDSKLLPSLNRTEESWAYTAHVYLRYRGTVGSADTSLKVAVARLPGCGTGIAA
jgi:hypothetical protein